MIAVTERFSVRSSGQPLAKACTLTSGILAQSQRLSNVSSGQPTAKACTLMSETAVPDRFSEVSSGQPICKPLRVDLERVGQGKALAVPMEMAQYKEFFVRPPRSATCHAKTELCIRWRSGGERSCSTESYNAWTRMLVQQVRKPPILQQKDR